MNCAQYPAAKAANPCADSPTRTINITADGPTGIINTAADTPPVHPEMDNEICEARVGFSRHPAWVLNVIRFGLDGRKHLYMSFVMAAAPAASALKTDISTSY